MEDKEENMEVSEKACSTTKQNGIAIREEGDIITDETTKLLEEEELKEVKANNKMVATVFSVSTRRRSSCLTATLTACSAWPSCGGWWRGWAAA